jgi:hypothetical protein
MCINGLLDNTDGVFAPYNYRVEEKELHRSGGDSVPCCTAGRTNNYSNPRWSTRISDEFCVALRSWRLRLRTRLPA